jgi:transposase
VGTDQAPVARSRRLGRGDRSGQSVVRRSRALSISYREWRDLPERFGDWKNVHWRFSRWAKSGVWERVFHYLAADADNEYAMIDSTVVRAHQHSAGAQKKPARTRRSDVLAVG